jgi:hypothetical protein
MPSAAGQSSVTPSGPPPNIQPPSTVDPLPDTPTRSEVGGSCRALEPITLGESNMPSGIEPAIAIAANKDHALALWESRRSREMTAQPLGADGAPAGTPVPLSVESNRVGYFGAVPDGDFVLLTSGSDGEDGFVEVRTLESSGHQRGSGARFSTKKAIDRLVFGPDHAATPDGFAIVAYSVGKALDGFLLHVSAQREAPASLTIRALTPGDPVHTRYLRPLVRADGSIVVLAVTGRTLTLDGEGASQTFPAPVDQPGRPAYLLEDAARNLLVTWGPDGSAIPGYVLAGAGPLQRVELTRELARADDAKYWASTDGTAAANLVFNRMFLGDSGPRVGPVLLPNTKMIPSAEDAWTGAQFLVIYPQAHGAAWSIKLRSVVCDAAEAR